MPANLVTDAAWLLSVAALAAAAFSSIVRSLVSLLKKVVEEKSRTTRFNTALKDSAPPQRAEIILACGQLEGGHTSNLTTGESEEALPPSPEKFSLVPRVLRSGRKTEPGKE
jgi:hypothetical protein